MSVRDVIVIREGRTEPMDLDLYANDANGNPALIAGLGSLVKITFHLLAVATGETWGVNTVDDATRLWVVGAPPEGRVRFKPAGEFVFSESEDYEAYFILEGAASATYSVPNAYDKKFRVLRAF